MTSNCRLSDLVFRKKHSGLRRYLVPFLMAILLLLGAQPFGAMAQSDIEQNALALKLVVGGIFDSAGRSVIFIV